MEEPGLKPSVSGSGVHAPCPPGSADASALLKADLGLPVARRTTAVPCQALQGLTGATFDLSQAISSRSVRSSEPGRRFLDKLENAQLTLDFGEAMNTFPVAVCLVLGLGYAYTKEVFVAL